VSLAPDAAVVLDDRFVRALPEMAVQWQAEAPPDPRLLVLNTPLAADLGLDADWLQSPDGLRFLVGAAVPDGATPVAQAYAGHQFGGFVPRPLRNALLALGAGLMASYTGVLISATAIPVWNTGRRHIPAIFVCSATSTACAPASMDNSCLCPSIWTPSTNSTVCR